jgi:hypothetical protein
MIARTTENTPNENMVLSYPTPKVFKDPFFSNITLGLLITINNIKRM